MIINHTAAIIVTGGIPSESAGTSGELLHSDGSPWCTLPDLPEARYDHTQTGLEVCGGWMWNTCVRLSEGSWTPSHQLLEQRGDHCSWASAAGTLLMGGSNSVDTGELLDANTRHSVTSFPLKYSTQ